MSGGLFVATTPDPSISFPASRQRPLVLEGGDLLLPVAFPEGGDFFLPVDFNEGGDFSVMIFPHFLPPSLVGEGAGGRGLYSLNRSPQHLSIHWYCFSSEGECWACQRRVVCKSSGMYC